MSSHENIAEAKLHLFPETTAQALCMGERDVIHGQGMFNTGSTQFGRLMMLEGHDVKRRLSRPYMAYIYIYPKHMVTVWQAAMIDTLGCGNFVRA